MLMYISSPLSANSDNSCLCEYATMFSMQVCALCVYVIMIAERGNETHEQERYHD